MKENATADDHKTEPQLEQLRALILGKENSLVTESIKKEARAIVTSVLTEALHDRQHNDGSVNKVLQPLVEKSVQQSVAHNSERLVSSLYPLVGSLVRKSVTAFLSDFMEKANQLLENSFTLKGLKWRINARQAGVSFSQYVASQVFIYRVEHVFLIHRETGLLLNSVNANSHGKNDADLISSMLTAINDFVGDSFLANEDGLKEQLQSVSTDNFNLLIKAGPSALVVAAVLGQPPQNINDQLQLTLEDIHRLYINDLNSFTGDNQCFESSTNLLRDCLLFEEKTTKRTKKTPWFSWVLLSIAIMYAGYQTISWFQNKQTEKKIMELNQQPGVMISKLSVIDDNKITLDVFRDPDAITVTNWLKSNSLDISQINIKERRYFSLDHDILNIRAQRILSQFPTVKSLWKNDILTLSGTLTLVPMEQLLNKLSIAGFINQINLNTTLLHLIKPSPVSNNKAIKQQLFNDIIGRISTIQLDFTVASEEITPSMQLSLHRLYLYVQQLNLLSKDLDITFGLLIMGISDDSGNKTANDKLSIERAKSTADILEGLGLNKEKMYITGLGQIDITDISHISRKVMFNIIFVNESQMEKAL